MGFTDKLKKLGLENLFNGFKISIDLSKNYFVNDSTVILDSDSTNLGKYTISNAVKYDEVKKT
jgi:hypothetical protein